MSELDKDIKNESNGHGGKREGAGRPPGSKNKISKATVTTLLDQLYDKTGRVYEDLLLEDFLNARNSNEALAQKYHAMLLAKIMPTLNEVEITGNEEVSLKQQAFAEALSQLTNINKDKE